MKVEWYSIYSVGIDCVDRQHKALLAYTNQLYDVRNKQLAAIEKLRLIRNALSYVDAHFKTEEDIMLAIGFDKYDDHKKEHTDLVKTVFSVIADFEASGQINVKALADYLAKWIVNHIAKTDRIHFKNMIDKGLTNEFALKYVRKFERFVNIVRTK
jgi:hemerythrin